MNEKNIIFIGGVAGTGKTSITNKLAEMLGYNTIYISNLLSKLKKSKKYKDTTLVSVNELNADLQTMLNKNINNKHIIGTIVEGHILCDLNIQKHYKKSTSIIFRTPPKTLYNRLKRRGYSKNKICENTMSESLDYCIQTWPTKFIEYEVKGNIFHNVKNIASMLLHRFNKNSTNSIISKHYDYTKNLRLVLKECNRGVYRY